MQVKLGVPGVHNAVNAAGAVAALHAAGADITDIVSALRDFQGAGRRYELRGVRDGYTVVDDYAHHPTEVKAVIAAARDAGPEAAWCRLSAAPVLAHSALATGSARRSAARTRRS